jgi:hypothetical protein
MKQTKIGNRFIVLGPPELPTEKIAFRQPTNQPAVSQRIIVIKDGQLVGSRLGR